MPCSPPPDACLCFSLGSALGVGLRSRTNSLTPTFSAPERRLPRADCPALAGTFALLYGSGARSSKSPAARWAERSVGVGEGKCPHHLCDLTVCLHQIAARYHQPEEGEVLHTRLNWITADTAALDGCVTYIEREIRSALEARPGSLGISVLEDRERGVAIFGSIWATSNEMGGSENTEAPMRAELAKRAGAPVSVEDYQVPIFELVEQQALTRRCHAVRLTRMQVRPSRVDDVIEVVGDIVVPSLIETPGFCDALLFADPASGRLISETMWRDPGARAAAPSIASIVRTEVPDEASGEIHAVEDYSLVFSSMQEP
jgi:hypothetical protein